MDGRSDAVRGDCPTPLSLRRISGFPNQTKSGRLVGSIQALGARWKLRHHSKCKIVSVATAVARVQAVARRGIDDSPIGQIGERAAHRCGRSVVDHGKDCSDGEGLETLWLKDKLRSAINCYSIGPDLVSFALPET